MFFKAIKDYLGLSICAFCVNLQINAQSFPVVFDFTSLHDTQNQYTGTLQNGAALSTWTSPGGQEYNVLNLGESDGYFDLGAAFGQVISTLDSDFSISVNVLVPEATDISDDGNFIWSFANSSTTGYLFLNAKQMRYAITPASWGNEAAVNPSTQLPKGKWENIIFVQNGSTGTVYLNGEQKAQNTNVRFSPSRLGATGMNYLGRSPYDGDAYLKNALYRELRIYNRALTETERTELAGTVSAMYQMSDAQAVARAQEQTFVPRVAYQQITLPTEDEFGTSISWQTSDAVHLTASGVVIRQETDRDVDVTLTATYSRGTVTQTKTYNVTVKKKENWKHYLFAFFPSDSDENIYFALGDDGYNYTTINNDKAVFSAAGHTVMGGLRDPHILRGPDGQFYMVATDMQSSQGWSSNRGMVLMKSPDLINWTSSTVHFPTKYPGTFFANVDRVWAPQTIYDQQAGRFMVYFSIRTNDGVVKDDKVYYCYANADFTDLDGAPTYLYDRGKATIDMDIVYNEADGLYHAFYKRENQGGICKVTSAQLTTAAGEEGTQWSAPSGTLQQTDEAVEGAGVFRLINSDLWILMYDCYSNGHYQFCSSPDLSNFTFVKNTATSGSFTPRHGTVIPITEEEYKALLAAFPCPALQAEKSSDADGNYNLTTERIPALCESTDAWTLISGFVAHSDSRFYTNGEASVKGTWIEHWEKNASIKANSATKTLRYLPAGTYKLQASCIATWEYNASVTVSGVTFTADDQSVEVHTAKGVPQIYTLNFDIDSTDDYTTAFGLQTTNDVTANWVAFDDMRLYFVGTEAEYHAALRAMQQDYVERAIALYPSLCSHNRPALQNACNAVNVDETDYSTICRQLDILVETTEDARQRISQTVNMLDTDTSSPAVRSAVHATLWRSLSADKWQTAVLPFDMSAQQIAETFGQGTVVKQLSAADGTDHLSLQFVEVSEIEAHTPFIIRVADVKDHYCADAVDILSTGTSATELPAVSFVGNYEAAHVLSTSDYYLKNNTFYRSTGKTKINAYRAYFHVTDPAGVKSLASSFENSTATGIDTFLNEETSAWQGQPDSADGAAVYDLQGRRVADSINSDLPGGLYITGGKKRFVR